MIRLVKIALDRPYTFVVLAILILIAGPLAAIKTPTDIFPNIGVPVIGVAWQYSGLSPDEMAGRIVAPFERVLAVTVNDVAHTESQSLPGAGIIKIYFQPGVDIRLATAQVTSVSQTILKFLPPGTTPPLIVNYNASTVPILQVVTSGKDLSEQQVYDLALNFMRPALSSVPGAAIPFAYGGKVRQIQLDLDPAALQSKGLSAQDVERALSAQNQIIPAGSQKIGSFQYTIKLNDAANDVDELNNLPVKTVGGATIYLRDVAHVRDGSPPQQNVVHVNGVRAVLTTVLKAGTASTLAIISGVKEIIPKFAQTMPAGFKIDTLNDQSLFVKAAVSGVAREGLIAGALTSLMILLFLGSWRSTVIIATSIPLAILSSIIALSAIGETLNIMTLGGLALAVGILVDDATVTIENINWHLEHGKDVKTAILDGAAQIVTPAFVSLLCICIVFVPMFTLNGVAGYLFVPMAEAVVFAMIASFILSRTLVPTMAMFLLKQHDTSGDGTDHGGGKKPSRNPLVRFQQGFEGQFERFREGYRNLLALALAHRVVFVVGFLVVAVASFGLAPFLGSDFFPSVDSGAITMHVRPPVGTRIEDASAMFGEIERTVRETIPPAEMQSVVDNIGLPNSPINLIYNNSGLIGYSDGDIFINLSKEHHPTAGYVNELRRKLIAEYPTATFSFLPADIISQILNFGSPAPLDLQISGPNAKENEAYALTLLRSMRSVIGIADTRMQQSRDGPQFRVNVDRSRLSQLGMTELDVTNSLATSLSGSLQVAPTFWLSDKNGVSYPIVVQSPEYRVDTLSRLENVPVTSTNPGGATQILGGIAKISREQTPAIVSHYNVQPTIDLYATTQGRDLGGVAKDVDALITSTAKQAPKGSDVHLRGQITTMKIAFDGLFLGLLGAIVLIYLLIVVNFQSWLDPFVIITALPAALAGIVWMLFVTHTTLSVPALTGAIMCMGVATANSILVVSFARERLEETGDAVLAAAEAGVSRFRPVLMTAIAMMVGMAPMALGLGEGGEQNAPLGRAVIGGLLFATCATLMFVPVIFSIVHVRKKGSDITPDTRNDNGHAGGNSMNEQHDVLRYKAPKHLRKIGIGAAVVAILVITYGITSRASSTRGLQVAADEAAIPTVKVIKLSEFVGDQTLILPGNLEAFNNAPIHARISGYLKNWYVDIGSHVKAGQLMAEIDVPDLDQQLAQSKADLASAMANEHLAQTTATRWRGLLTQDAVSKQEDDEKSSDEATKKAEVAAAHAAVDRYAALESFKRIIAPFDGVVTTRATDIGALINVGGPTDTPLFTVSDEKQLRLYVEVPQDYSARIKAGMTATFTVPQHPGDKFKATVTSTAEAINVSSGTLRVQLLTDNSANQLHPGDYSQVQFDLAKGGAVSVPASALMFRDNGMEVATVGANKRISLKKISISRDFGPAVEVASGLSPSDMIVDNPPDLLRENDRVRIASNQADDQQEGK